MTYKHLTFWSLVDRLDNWKKCRYRDGTPINTRSFPPTTGNHTLCSDLCQGVSVCYDANMPVRFSLHWEHRGWFKQFGTVHMTRDGSTCLRYTVPTVTATERWAEKFTALHHWLRRRGPCPAKKYEATLPQSDITFGDTRCTCVILLNDGGEIVRCLERGEDIPFSPGESRYYGYGRNGYAPSAANHPFLRCWDWFTPAKRAFGACEYLRRECEQFGRLWLRPFRSYSGRWQAGISVVHPTAGDTHMFISQDDSLEQIIENRNRIASWAMDRLHIPGPMFC